MSSLELDIVPPNRPAFSVTLKADQAPYKLGRRTRGKQRADIPISDRRLEQLHCQIDWTDEGTWVITDLESKSGTLIDGCGITNRALIGGSSEISIGATKVYPRHDVPADGESVEIASGVASETSSVSGSREELVAITSEGTDEDETVLIGQDAGDLASDVMASEPAAAVPGDGSGISTDTPSDEATILVDDEGEDGTLEEGAPIGSLDETSETGNEYTEDDVTAIVRQSGMDAGLRAGGLDHSDIATEYVPQGRVDEADDEATTLVEIERVGVNSGERAPEKSASSSDEPSANGDQVADDDVTEFVGRGIAAIGRDVGERDFSDTSTENASEVLVGESDYEATMLIEDGGHWRTIEESEFQPLANDATELLAATQEDANYDADGVVTEPGSKLANEREETELIADSFGSDLATSIGKSHDQATIAERNEPASAIQQSDSAISSNVDDATVLAAESPNGTEFIQTEIAPVETTDAEFTRSRYSPSASAALPAFLLVTPKGGESYEVTLGNGQSVFVIGRGRQGRNSRVDIAIPDQYISFRHCRIERKDDGMWTLADLISTNGTIVSGVAIDRPLELEDGTEFMAGTTRLSFHLVSQGSSVQRDDDFNAAFTHARDFGGEAANDPGENDEVDADTLETDQTLLAESGVSDRAVARHDVPRSQSIDLGGSGDSQSTTLPALSEDGTSIAESVSAPSVETETMAAALQKDSVGGQPNASFTVQDLQDADATGAFDESIEISGIAEELIGENLLDIHRARMIGQIARQRGMTFFRALVSEEMIRLKDEIYEYVGESRELPIIRSESELRDQVALADWLPTSVAEGKGVLTLLPEVDGRPRYATIDPFDIRNSDWLRRKFNEDAQKFLILPEIFHKTLHRLKNRLDAEDADEVGISIDYSDSDARMIEANITNANVPELVNYLLYRGNRQGASDIHIEPMEEQLAVRNRVDGILHHDTTLPLEIHPEIVSRVKILSGMDVAEKRRPQDGRIGAVIQSSSIDVRVSTYPTVYGEKIVMRLLDKNALRPSPDTLGLMPTELRVLKDKINAPFGLIMISGPTGSGKTTTLYSCLGSIDKNAKNVLTVEDPVEYRLAGVHQLQVNEKIGLSFASGLRTILRQDPDVIMVGECRDTETAAMAIQAALTGHIVFSTIHTNDAVGVITRLLDMGIDPFLVANSLSLAVAQRLVRRICRHCKTSIEGTEVLRRMMEEGVSEKRLNSLGIFVDAEMFYTVGAGCLHCHGTGYQGRQAVFEMFEMTGEARTMIMSPNFDADKLRRTAVETGTASLIEHGMQLVDEGATTHGEVIRVLGEKY